MNPSSLMSGKCVILYCTIIGTAHSDKYSIPGFVIVGSRKSWRLRVIEQKCKH